LSKPFPSAILGGIVVAAAGWIAIGAGWIEAESNPPGGLAATSRLTEPASGDGGDSRTVAGIYDATRRGVVNVTARVERSEPSPFGDLFGERQGGTSSGSGFAIDDEGRILTNAHVVEGATNIEVKLGEGRQVKAELVGTDVSSDLALLRAKRSDLRLTPIPLGDSQKVEVGDPVVAIGNPFGLDNTVTAGIVSALQRRIQAPNGFSIADVIQTDASINPGNSGGPLIDGSGRVIGINSQIATPGEGSVGIGFAVPSSTAKKVIKDLEGDGKVERAYLGITGATITDDLAEAFNLAAERGVLVQSVVDGGPADDAGVRAGRTQVSVDGADLVLGGDIIVEVAGRKITSMEQVVDAVDKRAPGDKVDIIVLRRGDRRKLEAELENRPQNIDRNRESSSQDPESPFGN